MGGGGRAGRAVKELCLVSGAVGREWGGWEGLAYFSLVSEALGLGDCILQRAASSCYG